MHHSLSMRPPDICASQQFDHEMWRIAQKSAKTETTAHHLRANFLIITVSIVIEIRK